MDSVQMNTPLTTLLSGMDSKPEENTAEFSSSMINNKFEV